MNAFEKSAMMASDKERKGRVVRRRGKAAVAVAGVAAGAVAALWAAHSYADAGGGSAVIRHEQLVGDWANAGGALLRLADDHTATTSGLSHAAPDDPCLDRVTSGLRWEFYVSDRLVHPGPASEGESLDLSLPNGSCALVAKVQRDGKGFDLCLVADADQTCTASELLRRRS